MFLARRGAVLAQQASLFGTGSRDPALLWAVGPNRGLVGRSLSEVGAARQLSARYDHAEELEAWDPTAKWSPSHVSGTLSGVGGGQDIALAVNGVIRAVGRTYKFAGDTRFSVMVPESAFSTGGNEVRVVSVPESRGSQALSAPGA